MGVKPYVLRYWETEFSILKPGQDAARSTDSTAGATSRLLLRIKELLHLKRFTIEGARKVLKLGKQSDSARPLPTDELRKLREIRDQLIDLRESSRLTAALLVGLVPPRQDLAARRAHAEPERSADVVERERRLPVVATNPELRFAREDARIHPSPPPTPEIAENRVFEHRPHERGFGLRQRAEPGLASHAAKRPLR